MRIKMAKIRMIQGIKNFLQCTNKVSKSNNKTLIIYFLKSNLIVQSQFYIRE